MLPCTSPHGRHQEGTTLGGSVLLFMWGGARCCAQALMAGGKGGPASSAALPTMVPRKETVLEGWYSGLPLPGPLYGWVLW